MAKKKEKEFNYAVGFYWNGNDGEVGVYAYGTETHYGTLEDAKGFLEYVKEQEKIENKSKRKEYKIFQLVELPI